MNKSSFIILLLVICLGIFSGGCGQTAASAEAPSAVMHDEKIEKDKGILSADKGSTESTGNTEHECSAPKDPVIVKEDYSDCFEGQTGCAVFYNSRTNTFHIYQEEMASVRVSPCSTFKVVSTLIGLEEGVVESEESKMGYDGTIYANTAWNQELNLKEAFQKSCVWYYRKLLDQVGEEKVKKWVNALPYGNCDINQWKGDGTVNGGAEQLNGFWLESSLEISAREQTEVLARIFDGNTEFQEEHISMLRQMMKTEDEDACDIQIYGKTGTGRNANHANAWYVGMTANGEETNYFAVRLVAAKDSWITGTDAKDIAVRIIHEYFK
ncbi:penicillin-binding transpeptidase domain-containing protein [Diplocloster modestus]|uniref:Beta-lactamase n=1 Tax=Diplocloster modestus TaxID=2850322 RepID=A0ABS6K6N3_9FIRM|nr:penicillin-binding transpeptidase domain-containing protein [Diplocloster modestus]MBU9726173.1 penicillin binding protein transpeptidase domain-containing protein [Diplocloster modestus]